MTTTAEIRIVEVDIDDDPRLADKFKIDAVPTILIYVGGKPQRFTIDGESTDQLVGTTTVKELVQV